MSQLEDDLENQKRKLTLQLIIFSGASNFLKRRKVQKELDRINEKLKLLKSAGKRNK